MATVLRNPISGGVGLGEEAYHRLVAHDCAPPQGPFEKALLSGADMGVTVIEAQVAPELPGVVRAVAGLLDLAANAFDNQQASPDVIEDVLFSLSGMRANPIPRSGPAPLPAAWGPSSIALFGRAVQAIRQRTALDPKRIDMKPADVDGVHLYVDLDNGDVGSAVQVDGAYYPISAITADSAVVGGVALVRQDGRFRLRPEQATDAAEPAPRCRRTPGAACGTERSLYSPDLASVLRRHLTHGIPEALARHRGFRADPQRPGWYWHMRGEQLHGYLRFQDRYFPVKTHRHGRCERMTVHLPREAQVRGPAGTALIDIAVSPIETGPHTLSQTRLNVDHRGLASTTASEVYEHAVRHLSDVHLRQQEQAALVNYYGTAETRLDAYMHQDSAEPHQRDDMYRQMRTLQRALTRIPAYAGRVYRGAVVPESLFNALQVGQTVCLRSFVRASGDRNVALQELDGRPLRADQLPVVLELDMLRSAHPIGLHTLRDEAEVLIEDGRVYVVDAVRSGELCLKEAGAVRQAAGQAGAVALPLF